MNGLDEHPARNRHIERPAGPGSFEEAAFLEVTAEVGEALERAGIRYAFMGGLAATTLGRPRWTHDLDVFVKPQEALAALDALKAKGYETERTDEAWLYKAFKKNVMVDVLFKSRGNIYFDDEMYERSVVAAYRGLQVRFVSPEDLVVIKAAVHDEVGPHHWFDALAILSTGKIEWDYLVRRARASPRRVLSLLLYAQSDDLLIPNRVVRQLFHQLFDS